MSCRYNRKKLLLNLTNIQAPNWQPNFLLGFWNYSILICCYVFIKACFAVILPSVRIIFQIFTSTAFLGDSPWCLYRHSVLQFLYLLILIMYLHLILVVELMERVKWITLWNHRFIENIGWKWPWEIIYSTFLLSGSINSVWNFPLVHPKKCSHGSLALRIGNVGLLFLFFLQRLHKQFTAPENLNYVLQAYEIKPFLIDICPNCSKTVIPGCQFFKYLIAFSSRKISFMSESSQIHSRPIKAIMAQHCKSLVFQRRGLEKQGSI